MVVMLVLNVSRCGCGLLKVVVEGLGRWRRSCFGYGIAAEFTRTLASSACGCITGCVCLFGTSSFCANSVPLNARASLVAAISAELEHQHIQSTSRCHD